MSEIALRVIIGVRNQKCKEEDALMHIDVVDLKEFYYSNALGKTVRRLLQARLRKIWPDIAGQRLLGLGFAAPFLRLFRDEVTHTACIMPAEQGVMPWPPEGPFVSALCHDGLLPLPDASVDRILAIHSLEHTANLQELLAEIWRVLSDDGRVILIVPNRRSMWARAESTPFGHGRPFSRTQLKNLLREEGFSTGSLTEVMFLPPISSGIVLRSAVTLEKIGRRLIPAFGGALVVEAGKEVFRPVGKLKRFSLRDFKPVMAPQPVATPKAIRRVEAEK